MNADPDDQHSLYLPDFCTSRTTLATQGGTFSA